MIDEHNSFPYFLFKHLEQVTKITYFTLTQIPNQNLIMNDNNDNLVLCFSIIKVVARNTNPKAHRLIVIVSSIWYSRDGLKLSRIKEYINVCLID